MGQIAIVIVVERDDGSIVAGDFGNVPSLIITDIDGVTRSVLGGLQMALEISVGGCVAINIGKAKQIAVGIEHEGFADAGGIGHCLQPAVGIIRVVVPVAGDVVGQFGQIAVCIVHGGETVVAIVRNGDDSRLLRRDGGDEIALCRLDD